MNPREGYSIVRFELKTELHGKLKSWLRSNDQTLNKFLGEITLKSMKENKIIDQKAEN